MRFYGKTVAITGGASGIGLAMAERFVKEGAKVAILDIDESHAEKEASRLMQQSGQDVIALRTDVANKESVDCAFDALQARLGSVDVFVNNAGISRIMPFLACSEEEWDRTLNINLKGAFFCTQAAVRQMLPKKRGAIIMMASQSGRIGGGQYQAYCASKFGVVGLTQSIAQEFAKDGIRINAICPGVVLTPLWDGQMESYASKRGLKPDQVEEYFRSKIPMGRLCTPEDVADTAVFLASDEASYLTGQSIMLTGGQYMF